jgi:uncharacterized Fe-S radical SAM superfamily protein PflX
MEKLEIKATDITPYIKLDKENEEFIIAEKSLPENAIDFYKPVLDWLEEYSKNPNRKTVFQFKLEYYNTSTAKQFARIFLLLEKIHLEGKSEVEIQWYYSKDDMDMEHSGKRYEKLLKLPFKFFAY